MADDCSGRLYGIAASDGAAMTQDWVCGFGHSCVPFHKITPLITLRGNDSFTRVIFGPACQYQSIDLQGGEISSLMTRMILSTDGRQTFQKCWRSNYLLNMQLGPKIRP